MKPDSSSLYPDDNAYLNGRGGNIFTTTNNTANNSLVSMRITKDVQEMSPMREEISQFTDNSITLINMDDSVDTDEPKQYFCVEAEPDPDTQDQRNSNVDSFYEVGAHSQVSEYF